MKKYVLNFLWLFIALSVITSCSDDDNKGRRELVTVTDGVFILNQGNFYSKIDGSLDYLNYSTNIITRDAFKRINGRSLGGTPNDAVIVGGKMYVAVADENRVEILDVKTLKAATPVRIKSPRALVADNRFVYVTSYAGTVSKIDASTGKIVATSVKIGANLEGITILNGRLYVCNAYNPDYTYNTNVVKLSASDLSKQTDIIVAANPNRILNDGTNVYVISWGNYKDVSPCLQKIDPTDKVTKLADGATYMAYRQGKIYLVGNAFSKPTYTVYDLAKSATSTFTEGKELFTPYAIGVDPVTGKVFITSYSKDPDTGKTSYTTDGYIVEYAPTGASLGKFSVGIGPGTLLFASHEE